MLRIDARRLRKVKMLMLAAIIPCVIGTGFWLLRYRTDLDRNIRSADTQFLQMLKSYLDDAVFAGGASAVDRASLHAADSGRRYTLGILEGIVRGNPMIDGVFIAYSDRMFLQYPEHRVSRYEDLASAPWFAGAEEQTGLRMYYSPGDSFSPAPAVYFTRSVSLPHGGRAVVGASMPAEMIRKSVASFAGASVSFGVIEANKGWLLDFLGDPSITQQVTKLTQDVVSRGTVIYTPIGRYSVRCTESGNFSYRVIVASPRSLYTKHYTYETFFVLFGLLFVSALLALFYVRWFDREDDSADGRIQQEQLQLRVREDAVRISELQMQIDSHIHRETEQKKYIDYLAFNDILTRLPNRRYLWGKLQDIMREFGSGVLIVFDIDNFNGINDSKGHAYGDRVLVEVAKRIAVLESDQVTVSRYGADEFVIVYYGVDDHDRIRSFVSIVTHMFDEPLPIDDGVDIRVSMGVALFPEDASGVEGLLSCANMAMHEVKSSSRNGYRFFDEVMLERMNRTQRIRDALKEAIDSDGFDLVYQPQIDAETESLCGFEALLRLKSGEFDPGEFIPVAESADLIIPIGRLVTEKVIRQIARWQKELGEAKPVAINFSVRQILDADYQDFLFTTLRRCRVDPALIELEITENIFLENRDQTIALLSKFRDAGIRIAIDDFGTGYSALSYLTFVPLDKIKFDRSLILRYLNPESEPVLDSLISLAHALGLTVVSEGIETSEQYDLIRSHNSDFVQGYYFSVPLAPEQAARFLSRDFAGFFGARDRSEQGEKSDD